MLGLSNRYLQEQSQSKEHKVLAITYGDVKAGALEAHNFAGDLSLTPTRTKNIIDTRLIRSAYTLTHSMFSMSTKASLDSEELESKEENEEIRMEGMKVMETPKAEGRNTHSRRNMDKKRFIIEQGSYKYTKTRRIIAG